MNTPVCEIPLKRPLVFWVFKKNRPVAFHELTCVRVGRGGWI